MAVELAGGFVVSGASPEVEAKLLGRSRFVEAYCKEKGWTPDTVTMEQVLEIRAQDGWKNPS